jgi:tRNA (guanine10-N2)-dimethyltransferase
MVNLSRTFEGKTFFDPFCGVGSLLLEAGQMGTKILGMDISAKMVDASRRNLRHYGINEFEIIIGDARKIPIQKIDSLATDPPYGRSASTKGLELDDLYKNFLYSIYDRLNRDGYACIAAPKNIHISKLAKEAGFIHIESHFIRVHGNLTREIAVIRR